MKLQGWERIAPAALLAWTALAAAAGPAPMLLPGEKVQLAMAATGERKTVAFAGIKGSVIAIDAKSVKGSRVIPRLSVLAPDGSSIDVGATNPKSTGAARIKRLAVGSTGMYRIGVETSSGNGGSCVLSTKGKAPTKFPLAGALTAGVASVDQTFGAAPGGTVVVSIAAKGKPKFDPSFDLIAPSGALVAHAPGAKGRATLPYARLDELGVYVVRVSGGPGSFSGRAVVRPAGKRVPTFHDVEALPEIRGFSPASVPNDAVVTIEFDGFAFSPQQQVSVVAGGATKAATVKQLLPTGGATVDIDLEDVPPGSYPLTVSTTEGNSATAPTPIVVTNHVPGVTMISPGEITNKYPIHLDVRGAGFDTGASVFLRRASDGTTVPLTIDSRDAHETILLTATPAKYLTGPCDLEIRDPDGGNVVVSGGVDLLGFRGAPASVHTYSGADASSTFFDRDAAYDETNGRVLVSVEEAGNKCAYVLFDHATMAVVDTLVLSDSVITRPRAPRVAWNSRDGTFALTCIGGSSQVYVRIVSASDIRSTISESKLGSGVSSQIDAAANPASGGYLLVWEEYASANTTSKLITKAVAASGPINPIVSTTLASHAQGFIWDPVVAYQGSGRFVVAWVGATEDDFYYDVRHTVVDANGQQTSDAGPYESATSKDWHQLFLPELAVNPTDGSMLLAYSYQDVTNVSTYRPACQRLAPVTALPAPYFALDANGQLPEGYFSSVVWNPARNEFVVAMSNAANRVAIRRVNPDGSIRPTSYLESYEGWWGVLYAGSTPGTMGLVRTFDGVDDDVYSYGTTPVYSLAGSIR